MDPAAPAWTAAHLHEGERVRWAQDLPPGAIWAIVGPLVGAGFAIVFAGNAVIDLPGRFEWLTGDIPERIGVPGWILWITGVVGFVSLAAKESIIWALTSWIVTDRRVVRAVRYAPFLTRSWPLHDVKVHRVKEKPKTTKVKVAVPARWGEDKMTIEARNDGAALVAALRGA